MIKAVIAASFLLPAVAHAQSVTWGAFIDSYYAYQFNQDAPGDAPLVTQPVRHNEFNINLAHIEVKLATDRMRGRLAMQVGTSVQANYAGEPAEGAHSGPLLARHIQEATAGYRVHDNVWVDGGIFLSHIGAESWISRDNWTYTRSLVAEYSPYYESGIKVTWNPWSQLTGTFVLVNGWQNISENNSAKGVGVRLDFVPWENLTFSYANFIGDERPEDEPSITRVFHDLIAKAQIHERFGLLASFDWGDQGDQQWYGFAAVARAQASSSVGIAARFERYADPDAVFITTPVGPGIETSGVSLNIDASPSEGLLWRTEFRHFFADDPAFRKHGGAFTKTNAFIVSSVSITF